MALVKIKRRLQSADPWKIIRMDVPEGLPLVNPVREAVLPIVVR